MEGVAKLAVGTDLVGFCEGARAVGRMDGGDDGGGDGSFPTLPPPPPPPLLGVGFAEGARTEG